MKSKKASTEALEDLHGAIARSLIAKIEDGTATAADLSVARQFLRDNGIDAIPREASPLHELAKSLPFPSAEDISAEDRNIN